MPKIKILQDTPFDQAGDEIEMSIFRLKYSFLCTKNVTDKEFIEWMRVWRTQPITVNRPLNHPGKWFELIEDEPIIPALPEEVTINGVVYIRK